MLATGEPFGAKVYQLAPLGFPILVSQFDLFSLCHVGPFLVEVPKADHLFFPGPLGGFTFDGRILGCSRYLVGCNRVQGN